MVAFNHYIFQALTIFNLFITYGDTFLPNPKEYDELYYEIIRMHQVFDNVHSMCKWFLKLTEVQPGIKAVNFSWIDKILALRHTNENGIWKDSSTKVTRALVNIRLDIIDCNNIHKLIVCIKNYLYSV